MSRNSVSKDITDLLTANLAAQGPYYADEWGLKDKGKQIHQQTLIMDTEGGISEFNELYENPAFSVTIRGKPNEKTGDLYARAVEIFDFLNQSVIVIQGGSTYSYFTPFTPLQQMPRGDNDRPMAFVKFFTYRDV